MNVADYVFHVAVSDGAVPPQLESDFRYARCSSIIMVEHASTLPQITLARLSMATRGMGITRTWPLRPSTRWDRCSPDRSAVRPCGWTICSRWPWRFCGQRWLPQISAAADDCRVDATARRWFAGKTCEYCRQAIAETRVVSHRPAFSRAGREGGRVGRYAGRVSTRGFQTHLAVCWNCHVAEMLRRTIRSWSPTGSGRPG